MRDVFHEGNSLFFADGRHHAVIQYAQASVVFEQKISGVRIGVQETCFQELHHVTVE